MRYKKSRYNVTVKTEGGARLFNARTGAIVELDHTDPLFNGFVEAWKQGTFQLDDHEWFPALENARFIVPEEINEIPDYIASFNARQKTTDRVKLTVMPTEECNFRCVYCYEKFLRPKMNEQIQNALKRYISTTMERVKDFSIEWFGGEPLAAVDVMRSISNHAVKTAQQCEVTYTASMTTNGYLLTPEVFEEAVRDWKIVRYQITVDGPKEFHDRRRTLESGGPTFDRIISNLKHIANSAHPDLMYTIRMNVDRDNMRTVPEFAGIVKDIVGDDKRARFYVRRTWGESKFELLTNFEARSLRKQILEVSAETGLYLYDSDIFLNPALGMCYAADTHSFIVGPDGAIYKCTSAFDLPENLVGRLTAEGTIELNVENFSLWVESSIEKYAQCRRCAVLPICNSAHCPRNEVIRLKAKKGNNLPVCPPYKEDIKMFIENAMQEEVV